MWSDPQLESMLNADGRLRVEIADAPSLKARFAFAYHQSQYLTHSSRFSDLKAGGVAGVNASLIGLMTRSPIEMLTWIHAPLLLGIFFLLVGIGIGLQVIFPRHSRQIEKGLLYWESVRAYTEAAYITAIKKSSGDDLLQALVHHNYTLAGIVQEKYRTLRIAFLASFSAYILLILFSVLQLLSG